ncbi:YkgJ family cysteine cluster protein [Desulforhopalus singaporensis]|nr:YkgJ family cysteine cluster protein [Desulforhopalus singaporensis]
MDDTEASAEGCRRCGSCCEEGGPALHFEDLDKIKSGKLPKSSLITIRKGELVHNPTKQGVWPAGVELIKLRGTGNTWCCCYYNRDTGCTIYDFRPHACRVLTCWDTAEIMAIMEKNTLDRLSIMEEDDELVPYIKEHEQQCSLAFLQNLLEDKSAVSASEKKRIEGLVNFDLLFRDGVVRQYHLNLEEELFYFGRPLFQLLQPLGIGIHQHKGRLGLDW